jgi:radical SAM superfamily enzyme YgiQ (UPF0313 family)
LLCIDPWRLEVCDDHRPFNYAVRRIQAAILGHPELQGVELSLIESNSLDVEQIASRIEAFDPDVIGASAYLWSFPTLLEVCRHAKRARPDRTIVFGGPSARPEVFELPQYGGGAEVVDAIVVGEGEACIQEILLAPDRSRDTLLSIPGLAVHVRGGWRHTGERDLGPPDVHPSPYQMGLMPSGVTCQVESSRGCPLSCKFCEWGDTGVTPRNFGFEYLVKELQALRSLNNEGKGVWLIDPGLNLNSRGFDALRRAEAEVGALRELGDFRCEIYPSHLKDEHLVFLERVRARYAGIGLQSLDTEVLRNVDRPFSEERFNRVVHDVASVVPDCTVEVILGLPGDSPDSFKRTLEKVRKLPVSIRVFHCLVLPGALMTRAPASFELKYDPFTLQIISCRGWSRADLESTRSWLDEIASSEDGDIPHGGTWKFLRPGLRTDTRNVDGAPRHAEASAVVAAPSSMATEPPVPEVEASREMHEALARRIAKVASGWKLHRVIALEGDMRRGVELSIEGLPALSRISVTRARPGAPAFRVVSELSYAYAREAGATEPDRETLKALEGVIAQIHPIMRAVVLGMNVGTGASGRALPVIEPRDAHVPSKRVGGEDAP